MSQGRLREWAGHYTFNNGKAYFAKGRVEELTVTAAGATATVTGRGPEPYQVRLELTDTRMNGLCSCPQGKKGFFCKHCVATALAWMAQPERPRMPDPAPESPAPKIPASKVRAPKIPAPKIPPPKVSDARLRAFLSTRDVTWLVEELIGAAGTVPALRARLEGAAFLEVGAVPEAEDLRRRLTEAAEGARADPLEEKAEWFGAFEATLAEVAVLATNGLVPAAIELAEYAIDLLVPYAEGHGFLVGLALARAWGIHMTICANVHPDPVALADRLVDLALVTGEPPADMVCGYAVPLGEVGADRLRNRVERAWRFLRSEPDEFTEDDLATLMRLREQTAAHEGGSKALIALLGADEPSKQDILRIAWALVVERKDKKVVEWIRRGLEERDGDADLRDLGARCLLRMDERREAVKMLWPVFIDTPSLASYRSLAEAAGEHWPRWRGRALDLLRDRLAGSGDRDRNAVLVEILLWEGDIEGAREAAEGCDLSEYLRLRLRQAREGAAGT
ncbi:hypothetical protein DQ384_30535 [Sphaerisporangium album]|uniref:SWIM-type domain-containing protein n=1 Tax=Sphaerisporangium album TaxID=509200 RepID=A0A367F8H9_9ACTN|nr:hypothetical protein DQ384_30535 [Sphaerisporangium album]